MITYINVLLVQIANFFKRVPSHFKEFPVSAVFLFLLILTLILNIFRRVLIVQEKKRGTLRQSCKYLIKGESGQDCDLPSHRKAFKENGEDCTGCSGKTSNMTDADAEARAQKGAYWKHIIVLMANYSKNMISYISFLYTLIIAIFKINK